MADKDPTWRRFSDSSDYDEDNDTRTLREYIRDLWNDAVDGVEPDDEVGTPQLAPIPQSSAPPAPTGGWGGGATSGGWGASPQQAQDDPWATGAPQKETSSQKGYSDEPPF
ncbi:hypothetical protein [Streptomyces sp. NPDC002666]